MNSHNDRLHPIHPSDILFNILRAQFTLKLSFEEEQISSWFSSILWVSWGNRREDKTQEYIVIQTIYMSFTFCEDVRWKMEESHSYQDGKQRVNDINKFVSSFFQRYPSFMSQHFLNWYPFSDDSKHFVTDRWTNWLLGAVQFHPWALSFFF